MAVVGRRMCEYDLAFHFNTTCCSPGDKEAGKEEFDTSFSHTTVDDLSPGILCKYNQYRSC